ncbi:MAG: LysM peptidoglycan-binding domain-containing protein [Flavobacteriales bacterium]
MRIVTLFIGLFVWCSLTFAQALPVITQNGQQFYQYTLKEARTLSQLESLTKTDIDALLALNPGLERGLEAGSVVIFPVQRGVITHKVQAQQTLFAIARLYELPIDSLYAYNPTAKSGLKVGQSLRIPNAILPFAEGALTAAPVQVKPTFAHKLTDTLIKHTVLEKETLYSISKRYMVSVDSLLSLNQLNSSRVSPGKQILVPIRQPNTREVMVQPVPAALPQTALQSLSFPVPLKDNYKIAVFLPFQLDSNAQYNRFVAAAALDYYMGLKMALDSLKKRGFSADIHVFDDNAVSPDLAAQLQDPLMKTMDLIFAPLQEKQAKVVVQFAAVQQIPVVFPVQMPNSILQMSPKFIAYTSPETVLIEATARHIHKNFQGSTVVLIESPIAADQLLEQQFKKAFESVSTTESKLKLQKATWSTYQKFNAVGGRQLLVSFSSERSKVLTLLQSTAQDSSILVVGSKDWLDYKELDTPENRDLSFLVALPSYFSYHAPQIIKFHKAYRKRYNADLTKMSCLGYDLMLHIGLQLQGQDKPNTGLISNMRIQTAPSGTHFENGAAVIVTYQNAQLQVPRHE